ncbi:MAG: hypothetical protein ACLTZY_14165 [Alistipes indistinctus]
MSLAGTADGPLVRGKGSYLVLRLATSSPRLFWQPWGTPSVSDSTTSRASFRNDVHRVLPYAFAGGLYSGRRPDAQCGQKEPRTASDGAIRPPRQYLRSPMARGLGSTAAAHHSFLQNRQRAEYREDGEV